MSRFYENDGENSIGYAWAGNIRRILRGRTGQVYLRTAISALLAIPNRRLIANALETADGEHCLVGAIAAYKGVPMPLGDIDVDDEVTTDVGVKAGLPRCIAYDFGFKNDVEYEAYQARARQRMDWSQNIYIRDYSVIYEHGYSPEQRWELIYRWLCSQVRWQYPATLCEKAAGGA